MSSRRNYSRESRSYYSRSSSHGDNRSSSLSSRHRPLSSLLTDRDFSPPSRALDYFDDPFFFEHRSRRFRDDFDRRLRWRFEDELFDDDFFNHTYDFGRNVPINYQGNQNSSSSSSALRNIPVQQSTYRREQNFNNNQGWSSNTFERNQDNYQSRENRISTNAWPSQPETPTRKRTSMTIFLRQPRLQYSEVSQPQRPMSTSNYQSTNRTNYY